MEKIDAPSTIASHFYGGIHMTITPKIPAAGIAATYNKATLVVGAATAFVGAKFATSVVTDAYKGLDVSASIENAARSMKNTVVSGTNGTCQAIKSTVTDAVKWIKNNPEKAVAIATTTALFTAVVYKRNGIVNFAQTSGAAVRKMLPNPTAMFKRSVALAATPVAATPVAATPVAAIPVAAIPVAAIPVAATPVKSKALYRFGF